MSSLSNTDRSSIEFQGPNFGYYTKCTSFTSIHAQNLLQETQLSSLSDGLISDNKSTFDSDFNGRVFLHILESSRESSNSSSTLNDDLCVQEQLEDHFNELIVSNDKLNPRSCCSFTSCGFGNVSSTLSGPDDTLLLHTPVITSTQEWLKTHATGILDRFGFKNVVLTADSQISGKGRGCNCWSSPAGCLMFSATRRIRLVSLDLAPLLNYVACLAVVQGVRQALPAEIQDLDLKIKWPNDIYLDGLKIGGILLNTAIRPGNVMQVTTGVGLNVHNRKPTTCLEDAVAKALNMESPGDSQEEKEGAGERVAASLLRRDVILARIVGRLDALMQIFEEKGFTTLQDEYLRNWMHSDQKLRFENGASDSDALSSNDGLDTVKRTVVLIVQGLSPSGFLMAMDPESKETYELTPDGNSLDMMQGLIRRKLN
mmetsp:Transcript_12302/g.22029  ORF Transcript_12302/g.22029 Transcript_12302/m.22029 type:complete len:428 (-) Transcript_12302:380-1663(-)